MTALLELPDLDERVAALSPTARRRLDEALVGRGTLTVHEYFSRVNPGYQWYPHARTVASVLQRVADGELSRVIILAPPRVGKSEPVSRMFPGYMLYRYPERFVGLTSYAGKLALALSRRARAYHTAFGGPISGDSAAVDHWETGQGGGMWAAGFGGSILGKGAHLLIVDDPIKDAEEANSDAIAERNRDWWGSTFRTRLEPGGAIVIILQRWPGVADLVQYLFDQEQGEHPERWHVVSLEAVKEADPLEVPATCTLELDSRAVGELLCPERLPQTSLDQIRQSQGEYYFAAQYQQRPRPRAGRMFPRELTKIVDAVPATVRRLRYWDKAGTEGGGAATAGVRMAIDDADGILYVEDVQSEHLGALNRRKLMRQTAEVDGTAVPHWIEQEPGSGGKDSADDDVRNLVGFTVHYEPASGDKVVRAEPFAAQWQAGNVRLVRGAWNKAYLDHMEAFPMAKLKDSADASSGAFNKLARPSGFRIRA